MSHDYDNDYSDYDYDNSDYDNSDYDNDYDNPDYDNSDYDNSDYDVAGSVQWWLRDRRVHSVEHTASIELRVRGQRHRSLRPLQP